MMKNLLSIGSKGIRSKGIWLTLSAVGIGYFIVRKFTPKAFEAIKNKFPDEKRKDFLKNNVQGWYGVVDEEKANALREEAEASNHEHNKFVVVNKKVINGYSTEILNKA